MPIIKGTKKSGIGNMGLVRSHGAPAMIATMATRKPKDRVDRRSPLS